MKNFRITRLCTPVRSFGSDLDSSTSKESTANSSNDGKEEKRFIQTVRVYDENNLSSPPNKRKAEDQLGNYHNNKRKHDNQEYDSRKIPNLMTMLQTVNNNNNLNNNNNNLNKNSNNKFLNDQTSNTTTNNHLKPSNAGPKSRHVRTFTGESVEYQNGFLVDPSEGAFDPYDSRHDDELADSDHDEDVQKFFQMMKNPNFNYDPTKTPTNAERKFDFKTAIKTTSSGNYGNDFNNNKRSADHHQNLLRNRKEEQRRRSQQRISYSHTETSSSSTPQIACDPKGTLNTEDARRLIQGLLENG